MEDTIQRGVIAGALASVADSLIHIATYFFLGTSTTSHYISQLIFPHQPVNLVRFFFGLVTHFSAGMLIGVLLAIIFKKFGTDYAYTKGIGISLISWVIHIAIIPNIVSPRPYLHRSELEAGVDLVAHIIFGLVATYYLTRIPTRKTVHI